MGFKADLKRIREDAKKHTWDSYLEWLSNHCDEVIIKHCIFAHDKMQGGKVHIHAERNEKQPQVFIVKADYEIYFLDKKKQWSVLRDSVEKKDSDFLLADPSTEKAINDLFDTPVTLEITDPTEKEGSS